VEGWIPQGVAPEAYDTYQDFQEQTTRQKEKKMTRTELLTSNPKAVRLKPASLDEAIIGLSSDGRLIYSENKILIQLQDVEGMTYEEALDFYANNTVSSLAYGNRYAPVIATETI